MATEITRAIVLRAINYGEADRVVTLLTEKLGKVSALARSARRSQRRFSGGMEPFSVGEAVLRPRRGELWGLDTFHATRGFSGLATEIARLAHAAYACELSRELLPVEQPEPRAFALLEEMLTLLDGADACPLRLRVFELRLLDAIGLAPLLDRCVECGEERAAEGGWLSARRGGLVCGDCGGAAAIGRTISASLRRLLIGAQRAQLGSHADLSPSVEESASARDVVRSILEEHLGGPLRSVEFIAKLNGSAATVSRG